ncbi:MAG: hypothetical protein LBB24_01305 [Rickettsiales bacterium]|jgi:hypothetical protein|nr:hypothetical protein [Rickettsiales bacterium]
MKTRVIFRTYSTVLGAVLLTLIINPRLCLAGDNVCHDWECPKSIRNMCNGEIEGKGFLFECKGNGGSEKSPGKLDRYSGGNNHTESTQRKYEKKGQYTPSSLIHMLKWQPNYDPTSEYSYNRRYLEYQSKQDWVEIPDRFYPYVVSAIGGKEGADETAVKRNSGKRDNMEMEDGEIWNGEMCPEKGEEEALAGFSLAGTSTHPTPAVATADGAGKSLIRFLRDSMEVSAEENAKNNEEHRWTRWTRWVRGVSNHSKIADDWLETIFSILSEEPQRNLISKVGSNDISMAMKTYTKLLMGAKSLNNGREVADKIIRETSINTVSKAVCFSLIKDVGEEKCEELGKVGCKARNNWIGTFRVLCDGAMKAVYIERKKNESFWNFSIKLGSEPVSYVLSDLGARVGKWLFGYIGLKNFCRDASGKQKDGLCLWVYEKTGVEMDTLGYNMAVSALTGAIRNLSKDLINSYLITKDSISLEGTLVSAVAYALGSVTKTLADAVIPKIMGEESYQTLKTNFTVDLCIIGVAMALGRFADIWS